MPLSSPSVNRPAFGEREGMFFAWTSMPVTTTSLFMLRLLFAGSFIGDTAQTVIPPLWIGSAHAAQPAVIPLFQAHCFPFKHSAHKEGDHKV